METMEVKELRRKYGIEDSRNEYTEEQILELSQRKLYYIYTYIDDETGNIHIEHKLVPGYVSEDKSACIFIKDELITGDAQGYRPVERIAQCKEIKPGIYHNIIENIVYCTIDELDFCLDYEKDFVKGEVKKQISKLEKDVQKLKEEITKFKNRDIVVIK
ncbi:hypothetical protein NE686_18175 [Tissierella carlieri]|uniref:Phage protein n=1 Tax=Tissierella carlieri TaxID=689904 RepID=A0ABT1SF49_9FIRM|nr:hypothetical protein [Tissierella carlieri]MCQ4925034.1 hypothetical protein [Tissierella carlieri]